MQPKLNEVKRISETTFGRAIWLSWDDGVEAQISSLTLRRACPCAECRERYGESSHSKPLTSSKPATTTRLQVISSTIDEASDLQEIWAIGNYALGMRWGDKHDSGIYTFPLLRQLCEHTVGEC